MERSDATAANDPEEPKTVPKNYTIIDETPDSGFTHFEIRVDSDEGRVYEKLSPDSERLEYMRRHAHNKTQGFYATEMFLADWRR